MYKFHYDLMKNNTNIFSLLSTHTNSFIYETSENFYQIMYQHKEIFDLSNQRKDSKYYCNDNKKVLGKMKDEYGGRTIYEITALRSKMYTIRDVNKEGKSTHKGHNSLTGYDEFEETRSNIKAIRHKMRGIESKKHDIVTYESNKGSLSDLDDKRYILDDGMNTLPYGHKDIPKNE